MNIGLNWSKASAAAACMLIAAMGVLSSCNHQQSHATVSTSATRPGAQRAPMAAVVDPDSTARAPAAAPVEFECRWTDQPIAINGRGDAPAWRHAQVIDHFLMPWKKGKDRKPVEATKARLLWDREYLYYRAEMEDSDLFSLVTDHDGTIWNDDAFELFFKPDDSKGGYYEFEVNANNAAMEMFLPARNGGGYPRFGKETKIDMKTAVTLHGTLNHWQDKDQGWAVEGRIPWRDFAYSGGRPIVGETWKFAACRVNISVGVESPELSTCAPLSIPNFHHYEDYARLKFVRPDAGGPTTAPSAEDGRAYGVSTRVPWTTSKVIGSPDAPLPFTVAKAFPDLHVRQPLAVIEEPGADTDLLLQHLGNWNGPARLSRFKNSPDVSETQELLKMDRLAYGMTLHPDYVHNGYLYIISNGPVEAKNKQNRISRFTVDRKPPYRIIPNSELIYLEWDSNGHNGGDLGFGPDGYLYHASGDGSSDSDANDRGQKTGELTSKMIRIDVDHPDGGKPYSIPKDNPWIDTPGFEPTAWAYGFRNPWRLAFDRKTGDLWVGQNGQDLWEAVYLVHKGENYGWSRVEGSHPFQPLRKPAPTPITFPIAEHPHSEMRSLTGGIVYRGDKFPDLDGAFIYGDWSTGRIWGVKSADHLHATWHKELARTTLQIAGFRETKDGDILVMDQGGAAIYKIVPNAEKSSAANFPRLLSETGLFISTENNKPDPSLIPYDVNAPLWSDGAFKQRYIAIPGDGHIDVTGSRAWNLPEGTVLVKTFELEVERGNPASRKRLETRLMTRQQNQWAGYTYLWNEEQTDATLIEAAGLDKTYTVKDPAAPNGTRDQVWHFPSRAECMTCHSRAMGFVLGPTTLQMNRDYVYPNGVKDNQLRTLEHLGMLRVDYMGSVRDHLRQELLDQGKSEQDAGNQAWYMTATRDQREIKAGANTMLAFDPDHMERLTDPYDTTADLNLRARSYLHANCAICHVDAGGGNSLLNLEYGVVPIKCKAFDAIPQHEVFGKSAARIIAPGRPDSSVLLHRVSVRGTGQMPPLASSAVDERAVKMLREWIEKMPPSAEMKRD
ncbi:MAG TPA: PQQ-dependent sugar dehydrogenase [Tepidisphaeraceae bacterium]|nr:PQQ-dependent sugar dehydrogenase [Tepidisphaeraceae bacterium]